MPKTAGTPAPTMTLAFVTALGVMMLTMISRLDCRNFRLFRDVRVEMGSFQLLIGPNGSGKSSLLDALVLLRDLVKTGLPGALLGEHRAGIVPRVKEPRQICFQQRGPRFEMAVELTLPPEVSTETHDRVRYLIKVAVGPEKQGEPQIEQERLELVARAKPPGVVQLLDGAASARLGRPSMQKSRNGQWERTASETSSLLESLRPPPSRQALASLPADLHLLPAATWVRKTLAEGIDAIALHARALQRPSPPGSSTRLAADGSNLAWVMAVAQRQQPETFARYVEHVRTALPELRSLSALEDPDNQHWHLLLEYEGGARVPSWLASEGTLRILALTFLGYFPAPGQVYLLEELENGIHPRALETVFQALSTIEDAQLLCTTYSPTLVSLARREDLLCFHKAEDGSAEVISGAEHPRLAGARSEDLGVLFAAGVMD